MEETSGAPSGGARRAPAPKAIDRRITNGFPRESARGTRRATAQWRQERRKPERDRPTRRQPQRQCRHAPADFRDLAAEDEAAFLLAQPFASFGGTAIVENLQEARHADGGSSGHARKFAVMDV